MTNFTRAEACAIDAMDPLASFVDEFEIPEGIVYLNGNSLGPLTRLAAEQACETIGKEWGRDLITSWNKAGWFRLPFDMGDHLAPLVGAKAGEMVVADSTSINQFRAVYAALAARPDRRVIVMEGSNFPTNVYVVQGLVDLLGQGHEIRFAEKDELDAAIDEDVAVLALTQVHYKSGHILDMAGLTRRAHEVGALTVWDLCHSAGAIVVDLNGCEADFAVGCTYKYLNGGPGSPAFLFAATRHHARLKPPITGWWGHARPFEFDRDFVPAAGIGRMLTGTQPIISAKTAQAGIDAAVRAGAQAARAKSLALSDLFIRLMQARLPDGMFELASPADGRDRGGHVAFFHVDGYPIMKALIARGVIGDFRAPGILRFGFSPLYLRYVDIWDAVDRIAEVVDSDIWRDPVYAEREPVT